MLALVIWLIPGTQQAEANSTYTITIPSTLEVENSGWNELEGGITASGTLESGQKLVITASSDNGFKFVHSDDNTQTVSYDFCASSTDLTPITQWTFDSLSIDSTTQTAGINVEDFSDKLGGTYTDTVTFTVNMEVPVTSVSINNAPTEALFVNSKGTLTATVLPDNATDKTVTWSSSSPDYVAIDVITGEYEIKGTKGYGSATITATAGDKTSTCTITGKVHHTSLQAGDVILVGETIYTGGTWYVNIKPSTNFNTSNGVITLVENNGKYKCKRGSNGTMPNWSSFTVTSNTDGLYIVSGTGTNSDKFVFAVHTKQS